MRLHTACLRMMRFVVLPIMTMLSISGPAPAVSLDEYPALVKLADRLSSEHGINRGQLLDWFREATIKPKLPTVENDLPGGSRRLVQKGDGIEMTIVNGQVSMRNGESTGVHAGEVLKGPLAGT